ncbi:hypothetical protein EV356DRAFT_575114 [Viridothelium virens]|uniref:Fungal N-terminal domain-containing protein n=1 Tax=Viridothelium virens TaxID=1048519 RepID=A0A6A6HDX7_VIRVR|nr:hypothetical protein EV356DRAFT_575114 [Viridothelium virens]
MSFGFSPSDIIALISPTTKAFQGWSRACGEYADITGTLNGFLVVLKRLEDEVQRPLSPLNRYETDRMDLNQIIAACTRNVRELDTIIQSFRSLAKSRKSNWDRLRFGNKDLGDLRLKLLQHTTAIATYLETVGIRTLGDIKKSVDAIPIAMKQSLDTLAAEIRAGRHESSILTTYENDEKDVWRQFRRELISSGFTSRDIHEHKPRLKGYLHKLSNAGLLEEKRPSDSRCGPSDEYRSSRTGEEERPPEPYDGRIPAHPKVRHSLSYEYGSSGTNEDIPTMRSMGSKIQVNHKDVAPHRDNGNTDLARGASSPKDLPILHHESADSVPMYLLEERIRRLISKTKTKKYQATVESVDEIADEAEILSEKNAGSVPINVADLALFRGTDVEDSWYSLKSTHTVEGANENTPQLPPGSHGIAEEFKEIESFGEDHDISDISIDSEFRRPCDVLLLPHCDSAEAHIRQTPHVDDYKCPHPSTEAAIVEDVHDLARRGFHNSAGLIWGNGNLAIKDARAWVEAQPKLSARSSHLVDFFNSDHHLDSRFRDNGTWGAFHASSISSDMVVQELASSESENASVKSNVAVRGDKTFRKPNSDDNDAQSNVAVKDGMTGVNNKCRNESLNREYFQFRMIRLYPLCTPTLPAGWKLSGDTFFDTFAGEGEETIFHMPPLRGKSADGVGKRTPLGWVQITTSMGRIYWKHCRSGFVTYSFPASDFRIRLFDFEVLPASPRFVTDREADHILLSSSSGERRPREYKEFHNLNTLSEHDLRRVPKDDSACCKLTPAAWREKMN